MDINSSLYNSKKVSPNKKNLNKVSPMKKVSLEKIKKEEFWNDCENNTEDNKNLSTMPESIKDQIMTSLRGNTKNLSYNYNEVEKTNHKLNKKQSQRTNSTFNSSPKKNSDKFNFDIVYYKSIVNRNIINDVRNSVNNLNNSLISIKLQKRISNQSMESNRMSNMNNSLVDIIYKNEEIESMNRKNRNKKIEENSHNLYMTSYCQKEKKEMISKEYNKAKEQLELQKCSFKPSLVSPKKQIDGDLLKLGFFERGDQIKEKFKEKHEKIKSDKEKNEVDPCTFKPEIRKRSAPNYNKKLPENKQMKKFLERQKIAKQKHEEMKILDSEIRMKPDINDRFQKLYKKDKVDQTSGKKEQKAKNSESPKKKTINVINEMNLLRKQLNAIPAISIVNETSNI